MKIITEQTVRMALDAMHDNYTKAKVDQIPVKEMLKKLKISIKTFFKIRNILVNRKLLVITGDRRGQIVKWHPDKCSINPLLVKDVYSEFTSNNKKKKAEKVSEVKPKKPRKKKSIDKNDEALKAAKTLAALGFRGVLYKVDVQNANALVIKTVIDLSYLA